MTTIENGSQEASGTRSRARVIEVVAPAGWINSNQRLHRMQSAKLTAAWREAGRVSAGLVDGDPCAGWPPASASNAQLSGPSPK